MGFENECTGSFMELMVIFSGFNRDFYGFNSDCYGFLLDVYPIFSKTTLGHRINGISLPVN